MPQKITTVDLDHIPLEPKKEVYYYDERNQEMYRVTFGEIRKLVACLEPWEEIDAEIFDDSCEWFIAITHEDVALLYGLYGLFGPPWRKEILKREDYEK